jgi:hypothetical protein
LTNDSNVSALVGTRVYAGKAVQDPDTPYVVFNTVVATEDKAKSRTAPIKNYRMQLDVYGDTKLEVVTLFGHIDTALKAYTGSTYTLNVDQIEHDSDNLATVTDKNIHRESRDYNLRVKQ